MEAKVSEILENILGMLALEGSFEVIEGPEEVTVSIEANDSGRLIGFKGDNLDALQLIVNQMVSRKYPDEYKRVVIDVGGWKKNKEAELEVQARRWAEEVLENGEQIELDPMPSWQRRIVHLVLEEVEGVESESLGEGRERHLVITASAKKPSKKPSKKSLTE
ncbi:MAG: R3H domain-containing nucleic acid-binding protein [Candidatus Daviesbacteria bacterium]|nr:R3H domain-containing nucleic acid-binding protein [Candidatus Daviesbacteria bacterium]